MDSSKHRGETPPLTKTQALEAMFKKDVGVYKTYTDLVAEFGR